MGAPSAESLSWPAALISAPPGTCALIELRSIHASPDVAISKSSLPTACPLIVMRSFPLSLANMDGAPAGFGALAEDAGEEGPKARRLKSKIPTRSGPAFHFLAGDAAKTPPATDNASAAANICLTNCLSRFMIQALRESFRPRAFGRNVQKFPRPEFARRHAWVLRRSRLDNRPAGSTASAPRRVYENSLHRGRAAGRPSVHTFAKGLPSSNPAR